MSAFKRSMTFISWPSLLQATRQRCKWDVVVRNRDIFCEILQYGRHEIKESAFLRCCSRLRSCVRWHWQKSADDPSRLRLSSLSLADLFPSWKQEPPSIVPAVVCAGGRFVSAWAPAGRGKEGGALAPWKCCKVFCALAVTVKTCVLMATTKKVVNYLRKKCFPEFAPIWKKILRAPIRPTQPARSYFTETVFCALFSGSRPDFFVCDLVFPEDT